MRMLVIVLSKPSISTPTQSGRQLPVMFTLDMSLSDEPLLAPCLMWMPIVTFLIDVFLITVSRPLSIDTPRATPLPSITPPSRK